MTEKLAKICITVDPTLLAWIDTQIEKRIYRNRSHAFDVAGYRLMQSVEKTEDSPNEAAIEIQMAA